MTRIFRQETLAIIEFCAVECELQNSGERSVSWMLNGYNYALNLAEDGLYPTLGDIVTLGMLIEPVVNAGGIRTYGVRVGSRICPPADTVHGSLRQLVEQDLSPNRWFYEYETIHPFGDGNGRTGAILFNWFNGSLRRPIWPTNFWNDSRRYDGHGA